MSKAAEHSFSVKDLALLKTGQYSDAQVTMGERVWKVHKSIVCQRSGYMRDTLFHPFSADDSVPRELPFGTSEEQAELLLEFLYSGGIATVNELSLADCVRLSMVAENFRVEEMVDYVTSALWDKLKGKLEIVSLTGTFENGSHVRYKATPDVDDPKFKRHFYEAVFRAYESENAVCRCILVDFVWAARSRLLGTDFMQDLNKLSPYFASDVLTTLNKGPQSRFLKAFSHPINTFCTMCAENHAIHRAPAKRLRTDFA